MKKKTDRHLQDQSEIMTARYKSIPKNQYTFKSLMRSIPRKQVSSGAFGSYYKYSPSTGLKVIHDIKYESKYNYLYLVNSKIMEPIFQEVALFNIFYGKDLASVVIAYQYDLDKKTTLYYPAILMPHFSGRHPADLKKILYDSKKDKIIYKTSSTKNSGLVPIKYALLQCGNKSGIFFHDLHSGNVIIDKNKKPWIIDFSAELIQYFGSQKRLDSRINKLKEKFRKELKSLIQG